MTDRIDPDDFAKLHYAYHEDTDLCIVADELQEQHDAGWLVWLYWPRMIARAKQAKSLGWFSTTPRSLAASIHDNLTGAAWPARAAMWDLLAAHDLVRVRQGAVSASGAKIDVLLVEYEKWQSLSPKERQRLSREKKRVERGEEPHWTVRHWSTFAFKSLCDTVLGCDDVTESRDDVTEIRDAVIESSDDVTTLDKTKQDEKEGARDRALPPTVIETLGLVRSIPGLSAWQLESNVLKAMQQFPSLPDSAICEAITAFEAKIPEGQAIRSEKAWRLMHACFRVAGQKATEQQASVSSLDPDARLAAMRADMAKNRHLLNQSGAA